MKTLRAGSVMRMSLMAILMAFVMTPNVANAKTINFGAIKDRSVQTEVNSKRTVMSYAARCAIIKRSQCPNGPYDYMRCLEMGRLGPGDHAGCCMKWDCGHIQ
jgi:hypothetical protein